MERMFSAVLISPTKIGEERKGVGDTVVVTQTILLQLMDARNLDRLSVALVFDPDADPAEDLLAANAKVIEERVSARAAIIQAEADQLILKAERDAADRISVIEAAATARIKAVEQDAEVRIAAASAPSDPAKPIGKPKPK